jgi:hypothetical protein
MRRAAWKAPDPNEQGGRTQAQTCPRPDANDPNRTIFGPKMRRAVGDALIYFGMGYLHLITKRHNDASDFSQVYLLVPFAFFLDSLP